MRDFRPPLRGAGLVAILLTLAFTLFYAAISRGVFLYGDDVLMYQVTEAMVDRGEVSVTSASTRRMGAHAVRGVDGRRYAKYGLGQSLAAVPLYAAARTLFDGLELTETRDEGGNLRTGATVFGTGLTDAWLGGLGVGLTFLLATALGASVPAALGAAILLGAASLWPHYSATFLSEPLAGVCLAGALLASARFAREAHPRERHGHSWLAISGFAGGALVATKVVMAVVLWPLVAWISVVAWRRGRLRSLFVAAFAWGAPFSAWLAAIGYYNWARFGSALQTGYRDEASNFDTPLLAGLGGLLFSPARGIVWYCPAVILGVAGFWIASRRRDRALAFAIAGVGVTQLLVFAKYYQWYGGGAWGPRFLVPLLPLWLALAGSTFDGFRGRALPARLSIVAVVLASLVVAASGVLVPFDRDPDLVVSHPDRMAEVAWRVDRSPLLAHLAALPGAAALTASKLVETDDSRATGAALAAGGMPDFAFVRYGSHALLGRTRIGLASGALLLAAAAIAAARAQKASESSPPQ
jgi:hypothetical protein